jgi:hypothetical protein
MDNTGEERKKNILRQRSHMCENEKEMRLSKSILREKERESISVTLAFMTFFCSRGYGDRDRKKNKEDKR